MTEQAQDERPERLSSTPAPRGRGLGVLVIESDPDLQWHLSRLLTVRGHRVVGTSSGDGAHALLEHWPADLVVVGEDLPGMDGFEVCRRIREQLESVQVVLIASGRSPDAELTARLAGAAACLHRPLLQATLDATLGPLEAEARLRVERCAND